MVYYLCSVFTVISSVVSLSFAIQYARKQSEDTVWYALSRSIALVCISMIPLFRVSSELLFVTSMAMILVQAFDGFVGIKIKSRFKTFGPFGTAIAHAIILCICYIS